MFLNYKKFDFTLHFDKAIHFSVPPAFIIRSVLGYQLKKLCCISQKTLCQDCHFLENCAYGSLFETILEKDNDVLTGRNRASHPYTIQTSQNPQDKVDTIQFRLVLFGEYIRYFPYIYVALQNAGKEGLLKTRIPFTITSVLSANKTILLDEHTLDSNLKASTWNLNNEIDAIYEGELLVQLLTPLRFKVNGKYTDAFEAKDFFATLERRMVTLCSLYGSSEDACSERLLTYTIQGRNIKWKDLRHYSARQKKAMKLGGCIGDFSLSGTFSKRDISLLEFGELFQVGKNTNFGLGEIKIWNKTERRK